MKKAILLLVAGVATCATLSHAAGPKLILEHKLTGFEKGTPGGTLHYSLRVTNPGNTPLTALTLSLMPRSFFIRKIVTVKVGDLGPRQDVTVPVDVVTPFPVNPDWTATVPLYWAGKFVDAEGKTVEFPASSKGGAR